MKKKYDPESIEERIYQKWEDSGYFSPSNTGPSYTLMIPPPNITGSLHMGHAFQDSIMDALIRYHRMKGFNTLWQAGTDHAGIATQMVVERQLSKEGKTRHSLGRENFLSAMWRWKETSGNQISQQLRRLGASIDWQSERFTMDSGFNKAVTKVFIQLYEENLIYKSKRLVNWDPKLQTAISDLEVENKESRGHMWYFRYYLTDNLTTIDNKNYIVIATTRPETILGDTGVAINPKDSRYKHLIGKSVILPLINEPIPIVADEHANMDIGTGCVKITPAHDFNDYELGKRCNLPMINIMTEDGCIRCVGEAYDTKTGKPLNNLHRKIPELYQNLERFEARKKIITQLKNKNIFDHVEEHQLSIPYGDRSQVVIEPLLTNQWFVRTKSLAESAVKAVQDGLIKFVPKQYENMYYSWMTDIQDWCISRQLWWGHQIPAWYDEQGSIYVGSSEKNVRKNNSLTDDIILTRDEDVLDTWFSSSLWTFATLGWPENTERLQIFHPTNVLVTGFDIIFFWVARMIMMTLHLLKDKPKNQRIPFQYVYVTGLIRDEQGQKMSKSKGNIIDPLDMITGIDLDQLIKKRTSNLMQPQMAEKIANQTRSAFPSGIPAYGTDALRYTLYSLASTGRDINWDMKRLEGYHNFCNKIWNAGNYVLLHLRDSQYNPSASPPQQDLELPERWIISELQKMLTQINNHLADFRFDLATQSLYEFTWNEYCSWYIELSKPLLWDDNISNTSKKIIHNTLIYVLEILLRAAHPFMPFITEEIWQSVKDYTQATGESIMTQSFPEPHASLIDEEAEENMRWIKNFITCIRNIRGELNINQQKKLPILLNKASDRDITLVRQHEKLLLSLSQSSNIRTLKQDETKPHCSMQLLNDMEILVPIEDAIDQESESRRLEKSITKLNKEIEFIKNKLSNDKFVKNAPHSIVQKEKTKFEKLIFSVNSLRNQKKIIDNLKQ